MESPSPSVEERPSPLRRILPCEPVTPLWQRVPTRDEAGRPLSDFLMVVPGLGRRSHPIQRDVLQQIGAVLECYRDAVVFAEMNLRLNLLWVSVRAIPGICLELPAVIHDRVPAARLVSHRIAE